MQLFLGFLGHFVSEGVNFAVLFLEFPNLYLAVRSMTWQRSVVLLSIANFKKMGVVLWGKSLKIGPLLTVILTCSCQ